MLKSSMEHEIGPKDRRYLMLGVGAVVLTTVIVLAAIALIINRNNQNKSGSTTDNTSINSQNNVTDNSSQIVTPTPIPIQTPSPQASTANTVSCGEFSLDYASVGFQIGWTGVANLTAAELKQNGDITIDEINETFSQCTEDQMYYVIWPKDTLGTCWSCDGITPNGISLARYPLADYDKWANTKDDTFPAEDEEGTLLGSFVLESSTPTIKGFAGVLKKTKYVTYIGDFFSHEFIFKSGKYTYVISNGGIQVEHARTLTAAENAQLEAQKATMIKVIEKITIK